MKQLAAIYHPLGLVSAVTLIVKIIFRDICNEHLPWDTELPDPLKRRQIKWLKNLPDCIVIPRSIPQAEKEISSIKLHVFGDASINGVAATVTPWFNKDEIPYRDLCLQNCVLQKGFKSP